MGNQHIGIGDRLNTSGSSEKHAAPTLPPPPRGILRFTLRLPRWLYRFNLGWLLGDRCLMLTHLGRVSGLPRQTVIEVMRHDRTTDVCVVACAWGLRSDWVRNIQKTPQVTITLGSRRWTARAVFLSETEGTYEFLDYARRHPWWFREITSWFVGHSIAATMENCRRLAKALPVVAFHPTDPRMAHEAS